MKISVVIPFHNEQNNVVALFGRLEPAIEKAGVTAELVCVDDGSADGTVSQLLIQKERNDNIAIIKLSRNFGKEAALCAGLEHASGDAVIIMDADLQHPPELIPEFIQKLGEGADVVYGVRQSRKTDGPIRAMLSRLFYRSFSSVAEVPIPADAGDFRILSRRAVEALKSLPERRRFFKGLYAWIGFEQTSIPYEVEPRLAGESKWSLLKLLSYAWSGLISFTTAPLRVWSFVGLILAILSVCYTAVIVGEALIYGRTAPGYATIAAAIFFLGGVQLLSAGMIGEYIGRIFEETKQRPQYIVEQIYD